MKGNFIFYVCQIGNTPDDCTLIVRKVCPVSIPRIMSRDQALKYSMSQFRYFFNEIQNDKYRGEEFDKYCCTFLLEGEMLFISFLSSFEDGFDDRQTILNEPTFELLSLLMDYKFHQSYLYHDADDGNSYSYLIGWRGSILGSQLSTLHPSYRQNTFEHYDNLLEDFNLHNYDFESFDYYFPSHTVCSDETSKISDPSCKALKRENIPFGYPINILLQKLKQQSSLWKTLNHDLLRIIGAKLKDVRSKIYVVNKNLNLYLSSFKYAINTMLDYQTVSWVNPEANEAMLKLEISRVNDSTRQNYIIDIHISCQHKFPNYHLKIQCYGEDKMAYYCNRTYDDDNSVANSHITIKLALPDKHKNHTIDIYYNV